MIIHFRHVDENAEGEQSRDKGPLAFGESTDEWTALCSLHTLTIYEQAFQNDPASPHKSLVDDVTDYGDSEEGTPLGKLLGIGLQRNGFVAGRQKGRVAERKRRRQVLLYMPDAVKIGHFSRRFDFPVVLLSIIGGQREHLIRSVFFYRQRKARRGIDAPAQ